MQCSHERGHRAGLNVLTHWKAALADDRVELRVQQLQILFPFLVQNTDQGCVPNVEQQRCAACASNTGMDGGCTLACAAY